MSGGGEHPSGLQLANGAGDGDGGGGGAGGAWNQHGLLPAVSHTSGWEGQGYGVQEQRTGDQCGIGPARPCSMLDIRDFGTGGLTMG